MKGKPLDVIIIGGSYAGLSAAMALGRSMREVLVVDSGLPCNRTAPYSHNFITQDGIPPQHITGIAKEQVLKYPSIKVLDDIADRVIPAEGGYELHARSGGIYTGRKLILSTGIRDIIPYIEGFEACWGISIIHCPYCHGYEFRGKKTGILARGDRAMHIAPLVKNLTSELTIFTSGNSDFTPAQVEVLSKNGISVQEEPVKAFYHSGGMVEEVVFMDGHRERFDVVYAALPFRQHSGIPSELGCETTEWGHILIDEQQKTTVPGVYACGDNSSPLRSVANAVASGGLAGAMVNMELALGDFYR